MCIGKRWQICLMAMSDPNHMITILKLREVYRHLSNAADRGDEAANVIADIVVKIS